MSVSNTADIPQLAGAFISLDMVKKETIVKDRRTKIICTLGPACWDVEQLETLIDAGMNVARFNFSHGDHKGHKACLDRLRTAAANKNTNVGVLLDTKGPEIRSGFFADGASKASLKKGDNIVLTADYTFLGNSKKLACSYPSIASSVKPGQSILCADGSLVLTVLSCDVDAAEVTCRIENDCTIGERKNMNLPGVIVDLPTLTEKDIDDIVNFGIKNNVDFIAASFVRKASDVTAIRKILNENGGPNIMIISKIENLEGLQNYNEILMATDSIMVARGDLGMEIPPQKVFLAQKMMIREANIAGKPVITATQMLESMISNPRPTRAECSDVANACYDGTDAVMLSGETANGPYFEEAVKVMARTCVEAESSQNFNVLFQSIRNSVVRRHRLTPGESLASSACKTAIDIDAKLIVVLSETGKSARYLAKFRPGRLIVCLTPSTQIARQVTGLYKGVYGYTVDTLEDVENLLSEVCLAVVKSGIAKEGDPMVVMCGKTYGVGANDQVQVRTIATHYWDEAGDGEESDLSAHHAGRDQSHGHLKQGIILPGSPVKK